MAVSDSAHRAPCFPIEDLLLLPIDRNDIAERKLRMIDSSDKWRKRGESTGRQEATIATPVSRNPQKRRILTTPDFISCICWIDISMTRWTHRGRHRMPHHQHMRRRVLIVVNLAISKALYSDNVSFAYKRARGSGQKDPYELCHKPLPYDLISKLTFMRENDICVQCAD